MSSMLIGVPKRGCGYLQNLDPLANQFGPRRLGSLEQAMGVLKRGGAGMSTGLLVLGMRQVYFDPEVVHIREPRCRVRQDADQRVLVAKPVPVIWHGLAMLAGKIIGPQRRMFRGEDLYKALVERIEHHDTRAGVSDHKLLQTETAPLNRAEVFAESLSPVNAHSDLVLLLKIHLQNALPFRGASAQTQAGNKQGHGAMGGSRGLPACFRKPRPVTEK